MSLQYDAKTFDAAAAPVVQAQPVPQAPQPMQMNGAPQYVQQQPAAGPIDQRIASRGLQPGGVYQTEGYCGLLSVLIGVFLLPCICCCPIDQRETYTEPGTGRKIILAKNNM